MSENLRKAYVCISCGTIYERKELKEIVKEDKEFICKGCRREIVQHRNIRLTWVNEHGHHRGIIV